MTKTVTNVNSNTISLGFEKNICFSSFVEIKKRGNAEMGKCT